MSKLERSCVEVGANCVEVRVKLCRSSCEVESKFERSCVEVGVNCVEVRAKLSRSSSEVVSKFERNYFLKFASKWKHNFRAYRS